MDQIKSIEISVLKNIGEREIKVNGRVCNLKQQTVVLTNQTLQLMKKRYLVAELPLERSS